MGQSIRTKGLSFDISWRLSSNRRFQNQCLFWSEKQDILNVLCCEYWWHCRANMKSHSPTLTVTLSSVILENVTLSTSGEVVEETK